MVGTLALSIAGLAFWLLAGCVPALSQPAEAFYTGRALDLVVGFPPGGSNDVYARHVARHMSRHIPGNPRIISRNMPGAGGLAAANWLYTQAPKDGTVIGLAAPALPLDEKLGTPNIRFATAKFQWIGRVSTSVNCTESLCHRRRPPRISDASDSSGGRRRWTGGSRTRALSVSRRIWTGWQV